MIPAIKVPIPKIKPQIEDTAYFPFLSSSLLPKSYPITFPIKIYGPPKHIPYIKVVNNNNE